MCADEADENQPTYVIDFYYQPLGITLYPKDRAITANDTGFRVLRSHIRWRVPVRSADSVVPACEWLLGIWVTFPEFPECPFGDYAHNEGKVLSLYVDNYTPCL